MTPYSFTERQTYANYSLKGRICAPGLEGQALGQLAVQGSNDSEGGKADEAVQQYNVEALRSGSLEDAAVSRSFW